MGLYYCLYQNGMVSQMSHEKDLNNDYGPSDLFCCIISYGYAALCIIQAYQASLTVDC